MRPYFTPADYRPSCRSAAESETVMSGKVHYAIVPIHEKRNMPGLYKMCWDEMSPWNMDLQNLAEEWIPGGQLLVGDDLMDSTAREIIKRKIFSFEGELAGYRSPAITKIGSAPLQLVSIITRTLRKCKHCKCYHPAAAGCTPIVKGGKS